LAGKTEKEQGKYNKKEIYRKKINGGEKNRPLGHWGGR